MKDNPNFSESDRQDYLLYNAVCRVALFLSEDKTVKQNDRLRLLNESLELFKQLALTNDAEKYYYALALALNKNENKALEILSSINNPSEYYNKKTILEEQLKK